MSSRWKERNASSTKYSRCVGENLCQSEEGALAFYRQLCLGQWRWRLRDLWQPRKFGWGERRAERRTKLLRARGSAELDKEASGSAKQGLWLGNRKVRSRVVGKDRSPLSGRGTVRKVRRRGRSNRRASDRTKEKIDRFSREMNMSPAMPQLGLSNDKRGMSGDRDVSLTVFITSMSDSKSLTYFAYRFFYFRRLPSLRLAFDTAKRNGRFDLLQCRRSKESSSRKKEKDEYFSAQGQRQLK